MENCCYIYKNNKFVKSTNKRLHKIQHTSSEEHLSFSDENKLNN